MKLVRASRLRVAAFRPAHSGRPALASVFCAEFEIRPSELAACLEKLKINELKSQNSEVFIVECRDGNSTNRISNCAAERWTKRTVEYHLVTIGREIRGNVCAIVEFTERRREGRERSVQFDLPMSCVCTTH